MLKGDFFAIAASALFAIYNTLSADLIKKKNIPISLYLTMLSAFIIVSSYIFSKSFYQSAPGDETVTLSADPKHGILGVFVSW